MAHEIFYRYESKNEKSGLTIFRVKYNLWDEIPPAERTAVRTRIKSVGEDFFLKKGFRKSFPVCDFKQEEVRHSDYIRFEGKEEYLFLGMGLLNRMRLRLNVEARALSQTSPEEMFNWKELEGYLIDRK